MMPEGLLVSVVDDDESVRESLPDLLRQVGFVAEAFSSAEAFLASDVVSETSCLVLDIAMPGMSGPDLQQELTRRGESIPIVFITGHGDESIRPRLLARGAVECLVKPFSEATLLDAVRTALRPPDSEPVTGRVVQLEKRVDGRWWRRQVPMGVVLVFLVLLLLVPLPDARHIWFFFF
jgi:FixJ family two-component response regulator